MRLEETVPEKDIVCKNSSWEGYVLENIRIEKDTICKDIACEEYNINKYIYIYIFQNSNILTIYCRIFDFKTLKYIFFKI